MMTLKPMLAALLMTSALPAAAQTAPAAPAAAPMMRHDPAMMQRHRAAMMQHVAEMRKRHADDLALLLDLKPAQRPALDAFIEASHPRMGMDEGMGMGPMGDRAGGGPADGAAPPTFTERLDRMDQAATRRADAQHQRVAAAKAFYQSLDPHQRQLFEAVMRLRHGGGKPGGMGGMGGHMRGGHPDPDGMDGPGAPQD